MKKAAIIFICVLLIVFGALFMFQQNPGNSNQSGQNSSQPSWQPSADETKTPDYPYMDIVTNSGTVRVQDYFSIAKTSNPYEVVLEQNDNYTITVFPENNQFNIILQGHPLDKYQIEAENQLLTLLKVSKQDLCKLNVQIGVPFSTDQRFAGESYVPSFCQNPAK